jgi:hypothetical protein
MGTLACDSCARSAPSDIAASDQPDGKESVLLAYSLVDSFNALAARFAALWRSINSSSA